MELEKVIKILERKTTVPGDGFSFDEISEAFDIAIREVGKGIPKPSIRESWRPNRCPTCGANLGGACDDGYYQNPWYERCPNCGQCLEYD